MGEAEPLAVEVAAGPEAVEEDAGSGDPAVGPDRQDLEQPAPVLTRFEGGLNEAVEPAIKGDEIVAGRLSGGHGDGQGVGLHVTRSTGRQRNPHGLQGYTFAPDAQPRQVRWVWGSRLRAMAGVRRIAADEAATLKRVRLSALADAPNAFGSTLAVEAERPDSQWAERASAAAAGIERVMFFVEDDEAGVVGLAGGLIEDEDATQATLISMWVDPGHRGQGHGRALVDAVAEWARERGAETLMLWVVRANERAVNLYLDAGFEAAGPEQSLDHNPALTEILMFKRL